MNGRLLSLENDPAALPQEHTINLPPGLVQRYLHPFAKVAVHWEKMNYPYLSGINPHSSELRLITGDPK